MKKKALCYLLGYDEAIIDCIEAVMTHIHYSVDREKAIEAILTVTKPAEDKESTEETEEAENDTPDM